MKAGIERYGKEYRRDVWWILMKQYIIPMERKSVIRSLEILVKSLDDSSKMLKKSLKLLKRGR